MECLCSHTGNKTTILVYMILNGKGSNWLWSTWVQSWFHSFLRAMQYSCLFLPGQCNTAACFYQGNAIQLLVFTRAMQYSCLFLPGQCNTAACFYQGIAIQLLVFTRAMQYSCLFLPGQCNTAACFYKYHCSLYNILSLVFVWTSPLI